MTRRFGTAECLWTSSDALVRSSSNSLRGLDEASCLGLPTGRRETVSLLSDSLNPMKSIRLLKTAKICLPMARIESMDRAFVSAQNWIRTATFAVGRGFGGSLTYLTCSTLDACRSSSPGKGFPTSFVSPRAFFLRIVGLI